MKDREKPGMAYWRTIAVMGVTLALVLYVLSIAPAYWVCVTVGAPDWIVEFLGTFYEPLWTAAWYISDDFFAWLVRYSNSLAGEELLID